ncbi:MAG: copper resistance system multicopper oxidase [Gammaproteobacteria bacterium]|nr:copper resistance system multicopper oxidase [Gammaproteobacteria bacterium]
MIVKPPFELLINRRRFVHASVTLGLLAGLHRIAPAYAVEPSGLKASSVGDSEANGIDLLVREETLQFGERRGAAVTINGTVPGPLVRLREGRDAILRVTNGLEEDTSIHWHGLLLPPGMDGVPGVSFAGIKAGETFTYRFPVRQNGTYWYHSHSAGQEQAGHYGPLIIDAAEPEPFHYDREHVVVLSDWTSENPMRVMARLKRRQNYYNFQRRTVGTFFDDVASNGFKATVTDRLEWGRMRMDPSDISDVSGFTYTFLMNGFAPESNWTALFQPGERVRLRFINAGAATYFDLRIPGLSMTVVAVDGQHVQPVTVDEIRIAIAETYDVIVAPKEEHAYTIFAEAMDRSGFARGTLATAQGMSAPLPPRRQRVVATMADMGMGDMAGMKGMSGSEGKKGGDATNMAGMKMPATTMQAMDPTPPATDAMSAMPGMKMPGVKIDAAPMADSMTKSAPVKHGPDTHGPGNSAVPMETKSRLDEPGTGLEATGTRVLLYSDLRSLRPSEDLRPPGREIELHLTGNMERYMWGFDGKKFSEAEPIKFYYGERVRLTLVNDTMMNHPIHLHGMFMELDTGAGPFKPKKHTVNVKPAERLSLDITADALGNWAFHCHVLYHMEMGMFRVVSVIGNEGDAS